MSASFLFLLEIVGIAAFLILYIVARTWMEDLRRIGRAGAHRAEPAG